MKRRTIEEKYRDTIRKQKKILDDFAEHEIEWADDLMLWYRAKKKEIPDDEYRACAFFQNREYQKKPGSLTLLYSMYLRCMNELPECNREIAFDLLRFRYKSYAKVLKTGGFDGQSNY